MPPATKDSKGLSPAQRECARLEALECLRPSELAERCGVTYATVSGWRKKEAYIAHVAELAAKVEDRAVQQAASILMEATRGLALGVRRLIRILDDEEADPIPATKTMLDIYRITSGQVGVSERTRHEHSGAVSIIDRLDERIRELSDEELDALIDDG